MKEKLIVIVAIVAVGALVAFSKYSSYVSQEQQYSSYLARAKEYEERDIPYTAVQNYQAAFAIRCEDEELFLKYLVQTKLLGEDFYINGLKEYVSYFPQSSNAYELLCSYYYDNEDYKRVVDCALQSRTNGAATEEIRTKYEDSISKFKYIASGFDEAFNFIGSYALVKQEDLYGIVNSSGKYLIGPFYKGLAPYVGASIAACEEDEWVFINAQGYIVDRPRGSVDSLSFSSGGWIRVEKDGKYGYMNNSLVVPESLPFEGATNFRNGVAAVKKDGKWAIVDTSAANITDYIFDDVIVDDYNTCMPTTIIFAKKDGSYRMYNAEGKQVGEQTFEDAKPFAGSGYAAVCINGKWGFADEAGQVVIEPQYEDADSFNIGFAPVCKDGQWGYIDASGAVRIPFQFAQAKPFSKEGIAAVKEETWSYIKLLIYE